MNSQTGLDQNIIPTGQGQDIDVYDEKNTANLEIEKRAKALGMEYIKKAPETIPGTVLNIIPEEVSARYKIIAFEKGSDFIKVAAVNPQDTNVSNALRFISEEQKTKIVEYLVSEKVFDDLYELYSDTTKIIQEAFESSTHKVSSPDEEAEKLTSKAELFKDAPVTKLVEVIISHAVDGKASDIHIEPMDSEYRVRFRVDGVLHVSLLLPKQIGPAVISRVKILSNLKIEEKRKPQDGRFKLTVTGKSIDFRVSTLPVIDGEKIVLRILDKETGVADIKSLGLLGLALENVQKAMEETYGMILLTGPTGSGKSTTSYAMLKILNKDERNIITLEDPVEYNISGLNQSQIKPEIGYTFASGLRSILRQDPNVILVGEIRDTETAELAVHAALTGHLLFSTLHTNNAIGSIPRLVDMGIEPFLLSSSLRLVVSQRLVRRICEKCKEEVKISEKVKKQILEEIKNIPEEEFSKYGLDLKKEIKFFHGKGCEICNGTGLKGRLAIYEVVPINDNIKAIIIEKESNEALIAKERDSMGILTIRQDGILKILLGITTIEELERVTEGNIMLDEEDAQ